jgi:hypothetical protein
MFPPASLPNPRLLLSSARRGPLKFGGRRPPSCRPRPAGEEIMSSSTRSSIRFLLSCFLSSDVNLFFLRPCLVPLCLPTRFVTSGRRDSSVCCMVPDVMWFSAQAVAREPQRQRAAHDQQRGELPHNQHQLRWIQLLICSTFAESRKDAPVHELTPEAAPSPVLQSTNARGQRVQAPLLQWTICFDLCVSKLWRQLLCLALESLPTWLSSLWLIVSQS